ncbi:MAG: hypothetical protein ACI30R_03635 [Sodaliphilus sp.]
MDLVSRLKFFLHHNGITNSTFADTCDIPRPTLSQLLKGRNKKVSDELISKIHTAYPTLNIMWLMFGDGEMIVPNAKSLPSPTEAQPAENAEFSADSESTSESRPAGTPSIFFGDDDYASSAPAPGPVAALSAVIQDMAHKSPASAPNGHPVGEGGKRVSSIMVFYTDNSFEEFVPRNRR